MKKLKQQLVDLLIKQIISDGNNGDNTVLDDLLNRLSNDELINALPEENWSEFEALRFSDKVKPTKAQKSWIKKAKNYLVGDEYTDSEILMVIGNIRDNADQTMMIDYVDGVNVWEKLEYSLSCKEFLK